MINWLLLNWNNPFSSMISKAATPQDEINWMIDWHVNWTHTSDDNFFSLSDQPIAVPLGQRFKWTCPLLKESSWHGSSHLSSSLCWSSSWTRRLNGTGSSSSFLSGPLILFSSSCSLSKWQAAASLGSTLTTARRTWRSVCGTSWPCCLNWHFVWLSVPNYRT